MDAILVEAYKILPPGQVLMLVFLWFIVKTIREIRDSLVTMNGNMREMQVWRKQHEKQDDERHELVMNQLERVQ